MIRPTVEAAAKTGIACTGPFPADTVYIRAFAGEFDSVVAMYHDQGQIATKLRGFNRGVTVTAGLDTVFTTPSHGTAFDIVGKGVAKTGAIESAVRLAAQLANVKAMNVKAMAVH
jgi:4-hydroxy-L-threonine phosphate dehydrogenase PdxA